MAASWADHVAILIMPSRICPAPTPTVANSALDRFLREQRIVGGKQKLLAALTLVVTSLEKLETILPAIQDLGRKHSQNYGVKTEDYSVVGATLLQSMKSLLGSAFTDETESAWAGAYQVLAKVMSEA